MEFAVIVVLQRRENKKGNSSTIEPLLGNFGKVCRRRPNSRLAVKPQSTTLDRPSKIVVLKNEAQQMIANCGMGKLSTPSLQMIDFIAFLFHSLAFILFNILYWNGCLEYIFFDV